MPRNEAWQAGFDVRPWPVDTTYHYAQIRVGRHGVVYTFEVRQGWRAGYHRTVRITGGCDGHET